MTFIEFASFAKELVFSLLVILTHKGKDYANSQDPFYNFRESARSSGITTVQSVYNQFCIKKTRLDNLLWGSKEPNYESIDDNIDDAINYLIILKAVLEEQRIDTLEKKSINHKY